MPGRRLTGATMAALLIALLTLVASACGSSRQYETDPRQILREAKSVIDATPAVHFTITSSNVQASGTYIVGGSGDAHRPDQFAGTLSVVVGGLPLNIAILSVNHVFYVRLPLTTTYTVADPAQYGFADPGKLIDPRTGLSNLLVAAKTASLSGRDRYQGEELYEIDVTLPGQLVKDLLTSADPSQDVRGRIGIDVDTHQVRLVVLTGPFFDPHHFSTYTLVLDNYGENISITPPARS